MENNFKQDKGVAGLTILLSLVVMLFVIGLLVMIFSIMGSKMQDSVYDNVAVTVSNETVTGLDNNTGDYLSAYNKRNVVCTVSIVTNATGGETVPSTNYTMTNCLIKGKAFSPYLTHNVNVSYTYTWDADNTATDVMNSTTKSLSGVSDWFDIFIVIGAMVVLILLVVIIITAIRGSGMVAESGSPQGAKQIGTA